MKLTVGYLKKVLAELPDDVVLADLGIGNDDFGTYSNVKRLLVLRDKTENKEWGGQTFLTINSMGSHFTGEGDQRFLEYTGKHFNDETFK